MKYNIKNIVKHTSMYSVGSIASKAIGFFLIPLYTHFLSPEDYGVLELLTMMVILTGIIIQGGIATAVFKFFNNYESDKDKKQIISTLLISVSSFCFWICILLSLFSKNISILLFTHNQFDSFVILMLISFFFSTVSSVPETYLLAKKESKKFTIITLVTLAVNLSLNIYFVAFVKAGIVGILYSSIISRFLNTSYLLFLTIPQIRLNFDLKILKSILKFSIPLIPAEIGLFIFAFSDRFFLSHMSNLENVGLYSLGYRFAFMISLLIIQPFMQIWQQEMYEICDKEGAKEIFGRIYTYLFGIVAGAALIMSIFIKDVIEIISAPEFHEAWKVVPVIAFALVFRATYQYFQMGMLFKSKTKGISFVTLIGAFFVIALNMILVPKFGAMGAALATLGAYFLLAVITYTFSQRLYKIEFELPNILKISLVVVSIWLIYWQVEIDSNILSLLVRSTSIPVLMALVWTFGILTPMEKMKIKQLFRKTSGPA